MNERANRQANGWDLRPIERAPSPIPDRQPESDRRFAMRRWFSANVEDIVRERQRRYLLFGE